MTGTPFLVAYLVTFAVISLAALGVGRRWRRVGYNLPWVSRTAQTWTSSHRAAFLVVGPTSAAATILHFINADSSFASWLWLGGVLVGGVIAVGRARYLLGKDSA
ncbi:hypothetical protein ITJ38_10220 [Agreia pratensis]|uniref:hypothetical protein n=1 Tax=Agreia pratensis TaxID=150121 RepID=UPI00188B6C05|nr:hypothetical protein [Agreia pratensis]MBF4634775.1 hypothetical protein [Agreia pratensis]